MKTLHVETGRHLYGGAQQVIYLTRGLCRRGFEVMLVCPPDSGTDRAARGEGIPVFNIDCRGDLDLRFAWRLRHLIADWGPDLVHCHSRRGADFLGGQAAAMTRIPAVVSRRVDNRESGALARLRYRRFRRVIAISNAIEGVLSAAGVAAGRVTVIRSAVDAARFETGRSREALCAEFGLDAARPLVASAAQFIERKGQRYLLDAVAGPSVSGGAQLVLFGQGPCEHDLRRQAAELGIDGRVTFAGFREDLDDFLGAFDVLVHTALREGLGVIALKAAAAGVPVVAFEAGGLPEVVVHERTGLLVPVGDRGALAAAIDRLLGDDALRRRYAEQARQHARASFSIDAMVERHVELYRQVLAGEA